jgi:hypothetical protein
MRNVKEAQVVDRESHQALFQELLEAKLEARVYLIRDEREGCGKSTLLKRLRWNCDEVRPRLLVSLVDLDYHADPTPFSLIRRIGTDLNPKHGTDPEHLPLPEFGRLEKALADKNPNPFLKARLSEVGEILQNIVAETVGIVHAPHATISGGTQGGIIIQAPNGANVHIPEPKALEWSEDLRPSAESAVMSAFFSDLRKLPPGRRAVIFIDSVNENAKSPNPNLVEYVHEVLLHEVFLDPLDPERRPENVVLCVAGRGLPDYRRRLKQDFNRLTLEPDLRAGWERSHTQDFLKLTLGQTVSDTVLDAVHEAIITRHISLEEAYGAATLLAGGVLKDG